MLKTEKVGQRQREDHINYRKDLSRSYRFDRALQRLKSPTRYICEVSIYAEIVRRSDTN